MFRTRLVFERKLAAFSLALGLFGLEARAQNVTLSPVVRQTYAHDPEAFTQGLVYWRGDLFESTGLYGRSSLRLVDIATGAVEKQVDLSSAEFGEGLALVDDRLVQLTWKEGVANVYAMETFQQLATYTYSGEGWGLCYDGKKLVMSDGSSSLFFRNAQTFELESSLSVERNGQLVKQLNELECVNGFVYANVWQSEEIVKIDAESGQVIATVQVSGLLTSAEKAGTDVLNGIAFNTDTRRFYITGKLWPKLFEVEFPAEADPFFGAVSDTNTTSGAVGSTSSQGSSTQPIPTNNSNASTLPAPARVASGCRCAVARGNRMSWVGWSVLIVGLSMAWYRRRT